MKRRAFFPRQVAFIALHTLWAAMRQRVIHILVLFAVIVVLGAQYLRDFHFGSPELKFVADLGSGAIAGSGTILAVVATAQLFFNEIEHRTVLTVLAKPVGRAEFLLGNFLGTAALISAFCGLLAVALVGVLWSRETSMMRDLPEAFGGGRVINYAHLAVSLALQWLELLVLAALTLLVASYARTQLFTMVTCALVCVICHLQYLAQAAGERSGRSMAGVVAGLVAWVFPNFQLFTLADTFDGGAPLEWTQIGRVTVYAFGYVVAACALAVFNFRRREL